MSSLHTPFRSSLYMIAGTSGPFHTAPYLANALLGLDDTGMVTLTRALLDQVGQRMAALPQPSWQASTNSPPSPDTQSDLDSQHILPGPELPPWTVALLDGYDQLADAEAECPPPFAGYELMDGHELRACLCALAFEEAVCAESSQHRALAYPGWADMWREGVVPPDWFAQWCDQTDVAIDVWRIADTALRAHPTLACATDHELFQPTFIRLFTELQEGLGYSQTYLQCRVHNVEPEPCPDQDTCMNEQHGIELLG